MKLLYTPEAISDLGRLKEFIEAKNPLAAKNISINIREGIDKLMTYPKIGLPVSKAPDPEVIRDLFIGDYTVRYLIHESNIFILRVWHNKENEKNK